MKYLLKDFTRTANVCDLESWRSKKDQEIASGYIQKECDLSSVPRLPGNLAVSARFVETHYNLMNN